MDTTKKRPLTPTSQINPNKKQDVEKNDDDDKKVEKNDDKKVEKNDDDDKKVEKNDDEEVKSNDDSSSEEDSYNEELNYCCSCNTEIKMESQICGRCAREMSYF